MAEIVKYPDAAPGKWIEYSDFNIGVLSHQQEAAIGNGGENVVQQETDPDAPIR
jgi:hypothetical protein